MKTRNIYILLLLVLISCGDDEQSSEKVRIKGTVAYITGTDGATVLADPVEGATVSFYPAGSALRNRIGEVTTDSRGEFNFDIDPGTYDIVAFRSGTASSTPPAGTVSKSNVIVSESQKGKTMDIGKMLY